MTAQLELPVFRNDAVAAAISDARAARAEFAKLRTEALATLGAEFAVRAMAFHRCRHRFTKLANRFFRTHYWQTGRSYDTFERIWNEHGPESLRQGLYDELLGEVARNAR